jgi:hypothetical protein
MQTQHTIGFGARKSAMEAAYAAASLVCKTAKEHEFLDEAYRRACSDVIQAHGEMECAAKALTECPASLRGGITDHGDITDNKFRMDRAAPRRHANAATHADAAMRFVGLATRRARAHAQYTAWAADPSHPSGAFARAVIAGVGCWQRAKRCRWQPECHYAPFNPFDRVWEAVPDDDDAPKKWHVHTVSVRTDVWCCTEFRVHTDEGRALCTEYDNHESGRHEEYYS